DRFAEQLSQRPDGVHRIAKEAAYGPSPTTVAPPIGSYADHDVGTVRARVLPGFWCHASADHAVTTRLLPAGPTQTRVDVTWLVGSNAVEGRDYDLESLLPFWQLTSEQDWALCERNQRGVRSSAYAPGPYSPSRERNVIAFDEWYRAALSDNLE